MKFHPKEMLNWMMTKPVFGELSKEEAAPEAVNPERRAERAEMKQLGFKSKKRYLRWKRKMRRKVREEHEAV